MQPHVAFDIGNVLCHFDIFKFTSKLAAMVDITDRQAYFFLERLQKLQDIGVTSVASELEHQFDVRDDKLTELIECWNSTVYPNQHMMNLLQNLRQEGVKIGLLSNMGPEHIEHLRATVPDIFTVETIEHISCEVGARKPTKVFFQSFVSDHADFLGALYIDDIQENLRAGKKYGFKVFHFSLEEYSKLKPADQKKELDRVKNMIINLNPNPKGTEYYHG